MILFHPLVLAVLAGPAPGQVVPRPTVARLLLDWSLDPLVALPLLALAVLYLRGRRRIRERGQRGRPSAPAASSAGSRRSPSRCSRRWRRTTPRCSPCTSSST